jgi:hypothetical protein
MSDRKLSCYDYVNHPYPRVRDALLANPHYVFRHATAATATQSAALHVRVAGIDIGTDVAIRIANVEQIRAYDKPATKLTLEWQAENHPGMFPAMTAALLVFPLSATETQLELNGSYDPPLGKIGEAIDAAGLHQLAEASVTRFIQEIAGWLREELAVRMPTPTIDETPISAPVDTEC